MRHLVCCAALLCAFSAQAAQVATFEAKGIRIVLMDDKCRLPELAQAMRAQTGQEPMAADVSFEGRPLQACWVPFQGAVVIIDEEGDGGSIAPSAFTKVKAI
jgi:hypothetical protein